MDSKMYFAIEWLLLTQWMYHWPDIFASTCREMSLDSIQHFKSLKNIFNCQKLIDRWKGIWKCYPFPISPSKWKLEWRITLDRSRNKWTFCITAILFPSNSFQMYLNYNFFSGHFFCSQHSNILAISSQTVGYIRNLYNLKLNVNYGFILLCNKSMYI